MFLITLGALLVSLLYVYVNARLNFWKKKNVRYVKPTLLDLLKGRPYSRKIELYDVFPNERYFGIYLYLRPVLVIRDPDLIKNVSIKWFDSFANRRTLVPQFLDPIWNKSLIALTDEDGWRHYRHMASPSFTSNKLKNMFDPVQKCALQCVQHYLEDQQTVTVNTRDLFTRFTIDVSGNTAFKVNVDSFKTPNNCYYSNSKIVSQFASSKRFTLAQYPLIPYIMKLFDIRVYNKSVIRFFSGLVNESIRLHEEKKLLGNDLVHYLVEAQKNMLEYQNSASLSDPGKPIKYRRKTLVLKDSDILGIVLGIFTAGFDTTANLLCFLAHELALNPDIQDRLLNELTKDASDTNGKLTYPIIMGNKYLEMVISETMRRWPLNRVFVRECTKPFTIEPNESEEDGLLVEKGIECYLTIHGVQNDPRYYPDPGKFDPERFRAGNKGNISSCTFLPFGLGPRNCIGSRYALLQIKVIVAELIREFEILQVDATPIPLNLVSEGFVRYPAKGFWVGLKRRTATKL